MQRPIDLVLLGLLFLLLLLLLVVGRLDFFLLVRPSWLVQVGWLVSWSLWCWCVKGMVVYAMVPSDRFHGCVLCVCGLYVIVIASVWFRWTQVW